MWGSNELNISTWRSSTAVTINPQLAMLRRDILDNCSLVIFVGPRQSTSAKLPLGHGDHYDLTSKAMVRCVLSWLQSVAIPSFWSIYVFQNTRHYITTPCLRLLLLRLSVNYRISHHIRRTCNLARYIKKEKKKIYVFPEVNVYTFDHLTSL